MAGYLMNMSNWESIESCVNDGIYSTRLPKLKGSYFLIPHEATFADYLSMKPGDNIYFFNDRIIYGIGELVDIQGDCKFLSHIGADSPRNLSGEELESTRPLLPYSQEYYRCFCVFKPSPLFFTEGVDMDEALNSNPQAFRILRAMWKVSFIKMGDEENKALYDIILKRNEDNLINQMNYLPHDTSFIEKLKCTDLSPYHFHCKNILRSVDTAEGWVRHEMALEAAVVDTLATDKNTVLGEWDYISHQVIASPFKPIDYMDKIDVFGYRYIKGYNTRSKFLIIELKKDNASKEVIWQVMKYVDWVRKEYANDDYGMIEAFIIAYGFPDDVIEERNKWAVRQYITGLRPVKHSTWTNLRLIQYRSINGELTLEEVAPLDRSEAM